MSSNEDLPESSVEPTPAPAADPAPVATVATPPAAAPMPQRSPRPRWRKWLFRGLATVGALALALVVLVVVLVIHHAHSTAPAIDRDAQVDSVMTDTYGKYSESDKGWLYVEPNSKTTYLMQVVQRAKVDLPDTAVKGNTALYFVASGTPMSNPDLRERMLGLFVIQPDPTRPGNALVQIYDPYIELDGRTPVGPQDIRFETLSKDTWGWMLKVARDDTPRPGELRVDNMLYAPHDGHIVRMAVFPASGHFDEAAGCVSAEAAQADTVRRDAAIAASAAAAASASASPASDAEESDNEEDGDDEQAGPNCLDHTWTYRTGALPAEGFVEIVVTGGGQIRGERRASKSYKLVFDPKSFSYLVPEELEGF